jgi:GT2 family glycosyltransferase
MSPRVAIVIVNWNGMRDTLECLASLQQDHFQEKQVIVVDNGSADESVSTIRAAFPEVTVLETSANLGFTGGNNVGIEYALKAGAEYVYLLNNDTVCAPDALSALITAAEEEPGLGLLTPVIHYYDEPEEIWFGGSRIDLSLGVALHDNSRVPTLVEQPREIPWASGCAMLLRAEVVKRLGGFDDRYFLIWEDVDLSMRVRQSGSRIGLVPAARIYHKVSRSFAGLSWMGRYYHTRNRLLLVRSHASTRHVAVAVGVLVDAAREAVRLLRGGGSLRVAGRIVGTALSAVQAHLRKRYGPALS